MWMVFVMTLRKMWRWLQGWGGWSRLRMQEEVAVNMRNVIGKFNSGNMESFCLNTQILITPQFINQRVSQQRLSNHICLFGERQKQDIVVSKFRLFLSVEVMVYQQRLMNPTVLDILTLFVVKNTSFKGGQKKISQHRLNIICECINSYSPILDLSNRLNMVHRKQIRCSIS